MYFKVTSSRDTGVGLFRAGLVYRVDDKDRKVASVIAPHLATGVFVEVSEKDARTSMVQSLAGIGPASPQASAPAKSAKPSSPAKRAAASE